MIDEERMEAFVGDMKLLECRWNGHILYLLPQRAVWIPESNALCIADTHFGKAATFRLGGLPVPSGTTSAMLQRIDSLVRATGATTLVFLGDFIHSSRSANRDYIDELVAWRESCSGLDVILVRGNHDRHNLNLIEQFLFQVVDEGEMLGGFELRHFPVDPLTAGPYRSSNNAMVLCGHLHPGCAVPVAPRLVKSFPCFVIEQKQIILPAFGEFTGLARVHPDPTKRLIACIENEVIEIRREK